MIYTTLNAIRAHGPCGVKRGDNHGWNKLLAHLGKTRADDEPLGLDVILASNGLDDALWCLRTVEGHDQAVRRLALSFARHVEHLSDDPRVKACNNTTERYLDGKAMINELEAACAAACAAAWAARAAAREAARAAAAGDAEREWQRAEFVKMLEAAK